MAAIQQHEGAVIKPEVPCEPAASSISEGPFLRRRGAPSAVECAQRFRLLFGYSGSEQRDFEVSCRFPVPAGVLTSM
jgi:hypothetical protein